VRLGGTNANDLGSANNDGTYVNTPTFGVTGPITGEPSVTAITFTKSNACKSTKAEMEGPLNPITRA
jgi:hypothetical protein